MKSKKILLVIILASLALYIVLTLKDNNFQSDNTDSHHLKTTVSDSRTTENRFIKRVSFLDKSNIKSMNMSSGNILKEQDSEGIYLRIGDKEVDRLTISFDSSIIHPPASAVGIWFWIENKDALSNLVVQINHKGNPLAKWIRSMKSMPQDWKLQNGWNLLRFTSSDGMDADLLKKHWGKGIESIALSFITNKPTTAKIKDVWVECPEKAHLLFIQDGGYVSFLDKAYSSLVDRNIPVTWSIDIDLLGNGEAPLDRITEEDVLRLAKENNNSINYHGYDGKPTKNMTQGQIVEDHIKSNKWLKSRGFYSANIWRSAWVQNLAKNHYALKDYIFAYATPYSNSGLNSWPLIDRYNIKRVSLHGRTNDFFDKIFDVLKATNQLFVCYTHGLNDSIQYQISNKEWNYFLKKLDVGISENRIEGVVFEDLMTKSGVNVKESYKNYERMKSLFGRYSFFLEEK